MTPRLDISPSLIQFLSPTGNAFRTAGSALVDLGTQKVQDAKDEAAKNELLAKQQALMNATASKNRALNPEAVNRINTSYGITPDSPLANPNAPTQANKDIGLVDLGLPQKPETPVFKDVSINGKNFIHKYNSKTGLFENTNLESENKKSSDTMDQYKQKYVGGFTNENNERVGIRGDGSTFIIGKVKDYNAKASQIPENMTATTGLSPEALRWASENGLVSRFGEQMYISKDDYAKARNRALFGNEEAQ